MIDLNSTNVWSARKYISSSSTSVLSTIFFTISLPIAVLISVLPTIYFVIASLSITFFVIATWRNTPFLTGCKKTRGNKFWYTGCSTSGWKDRTEKCRFFVRFTLINEKTSCKKCYAFLMSITTISIIRLGRAKPQAYAKHNGRTWIQFSFESWSFRFLAYSHKRNKRMSLLRFS